MKLNKNTSFVLIHLLNGLNSASKISEQMPNINLRSIQRALVRLTQLGLISRRGINNPYYTINYDKVLTQALNVDLLENVYRPKSSFNFNLLSWLINNPDYNLADLLNIKKISSANPMTKKELEYLTVELAWKSSELEGNTYSLLDTEILLTKGIKAKDKTNFENQMILNHKQALDFIVGNPNLFKQKIKFATVEEIHRRLGHNLEIEPGIRRRLVRISSSNYEPLFDPHKIRETMDLILKIINCQADPLIKALLAFGFIPYLQAFEDGNKRTGRLLANAILIHSINQGFSLRSVEAKQLALAHLSFYEFNSLVGLSRILRQELRQ